MRALICGSLIALLWATSAPEEAAPDKVLQDRFDQGAQVGDPTLDADLTRYPDLSPS